VSGRLEGTPDGSDTLGTTKLDEIDLVPTDNVDPIEFPVGTGVGS
jgi:hypothetical protein